MINESEFLHYITTLLELHPDYSEIQLNMHIKKKHRYIIDIFAQRKTEKLIIECKRYIALTISNIDGIITQLLKYQTLIEDSKVVLAIPATLQKAERKILSESNIEVWDYKFIIKNFKQQIIDSSPSNLKEFFIKQINKLTFKTKEEELIEKLSECRPGKVDWNIYQKLIGNILDYLFSPPLEKTLAEVTDKTRTNRRDFIMANYSEKGFWAILRKKYQADYIVIDAKNYKGSVHKKDVLQIANYLKSHGPGLFGIIITRKGGDKVGCEYSLREQWLVHKKLILIINDKELKEMLIAKSDGRLPESIIKRKIDQFRLSM